MPQSLATPLAEGVVLKTLATDGCARMIGSMGDDCTAERTKMSILARKLAMDAADLAMACQHDTARSLKADNSVVTQADHDAQRLIVDAILREYPEHAIVAEETLEPQATATAPTSARFCWVIDPIDGTRNYVAGFPCFSTSIAVLDQGRPVVAVVVEHNLRHVYAGEIGCGTTLNDRTVRVHPFDQTTDTMVAGPSSKDKVTVAVQQSWAQTRGLVYRNTGSTAVHLGMVAAGILDGAFANRCKIWDIAAGALLVTEAGGRITDLMGQSIDVFDLSADPNANTPCLAASPEAHDRLISTIREAAEAATGA